MKRLDVRVPLVAASVMVLSACQPIRTTGTTGFELELTKICKVWKEISFSDSRDSEQTVGEVRGNNAARNAFCRRDRPQ